MSTDFVKRRRLYSGYLPNHTTDSVSLVICFMRNLINICFVSDFALRQISHAPRIYDVILLTWLQSFDLGKIRFMDINFLLCSVEDTIFPPSTCNLHAGKFLWKSFQFFKLARALSAHINPQIYFAKNDTALKSRTEICIREKGQFKNFSTSWWLCTFNSDFRSIHIFNWNCYHFISSFSLFSFLSFISILSHWLFLMWVSSWLMQFVTEEY